MSKKSASLKDLKTPRSSGRGGPLGRDPRRGHKAPRGRCQFPKAEVLAVRHARYFVKNIEILAYRYISKYNLRREQDQHGHFVQGIGNTLCDILGHARYASRWLSDIKTNVGAGEAADRNLPRDNSAAQKPTKTSREPEDKRVPFGVCAQTEAAWCNLGMQTMGGICYSTYECAWRRVKGIVNSTGETG